MSNMKFLVLNGPGLSELSNFEGKDYGGISLQDIEQRCVTLCEQLQIKLDFRQTDDLDEMEHFITRDSEQFDALILNPAGCSRTASIEPERYRSALMTIAHHKKPVTEVHITNIFKPDAENTKPLHVPECDIGFISGLGIHSYLTAIKAIHKRLVENAA